MNLKKVNDSFINIKLGFIDYDINCRSEACKYFRKNSVFKSNTNFLIYTKCISIIYEIFYYQKANEITSKNSLDYLDLFKFAIMKYFKDLEPNHFNKFLKKLNFCCFSFLTNKKYSFSDAENSLIMNSIFYKNQIAFENFICYNIYIMIWFCYDVNKFIHKEMKKIKNSNMDIYFEDDFNEKIYICLKKFLFNDQNSTIKEEIEEYNKTFHSGIKSLFLENIIDLKQFMNDFYTNLNNYSFRFNSLTKMLLIYILELDQVRI